MTQGQREPKSLHCPRCGSLMHKPAGGNLYWHADNNHPRCDITNIIETVLEVHNTEVSKPPSPKAPNKRGHK